MTAEQGLQVMVFTIFAPTKVTVHYLLDEYFQS